MGYNNSNIFRMLKAGQEISELQDSSMVFIPGQISLDMGTD